MSKKPNTTDTKIERFRTRRELKSYRDFRDIAAEPELFDTCKDFDDKHIETNKADSNTDISDSNSSYPDDPPEVPAAIIRQRRSLVRKHESDRQGRLLLVSMLENFCQLYDESSERNQKLFHIICNQLKDMGIISSEDFVDELSAVRGGYKRAFRDLVVRAMEAIGDEDGRNAIDYNPFAQSDGHPALSRQSSALSTRLAVGVEKPMTRNISFSSLGTGEDFQSVWNARPSRYHEDFVRLSLLGKGAFGTVVKVRNKLDGVEYAVKKLVLGSNSLQRILREVKFQARLSHPNVVRYFSAWVEDTPTDGSHAERTTDGETDYLDAATGISFGEFSSEAVSPKGRIMEVWTDTDDNDVDIVFAEEGASQDRPVNEFRAITPSTDTESECRGAGIDPSSDGSNNHVHFGFFHTNESDSSDDETGSLFTGNLSRTTVLYTDPTRRVPTVPTLPAPSRSQLPPDLHLTLFIQTELCGHSLRDFLRHRNTSAPSTPINLMQSRKIFMDICEGLCYLHTRGVIHRDIKPRNIFWKDGIENGGRWKIGDFGLVTASDLDKNAEGSDDEFDLDRGSPAYELDIGETLLRRSNSQPHPYSDRTAGVGTVTYASPEQLRPTSTTPYSPASDIYSLGIILFELLHPFATAMERARSLQALKAGVVPDDFMKRYPIEAGWIFCMLRTDPRARPSSSEILEWVEGKSHWPSS